MSLADKRKLYPDMPEIEYLPMGGNVLIYRLKGDEKTAGGLFIPEENREIRSRGILLAAGLKAHDKLADALIEVGDEVFCGRFSGDDRDTKEREAGKAKVTLWEAKVEDIHGSAEALKRYENHDVIRSDGEDGYEYGTHYYQRKKKGRAA